jgi:hypothetical protein
VICGAWSVGVFDGEGLGDLDGVGDFEVLGDGLGECVDEDGDGFGDLEVDGVDPG